ncbi:MAG: M3 family metallopeptidase, partial [Pseudanabaena sp.]
MSEVNNPLLIGKGLPPFPDIKAEQVIPAITQLLEETSKGLTELEANLQPTWAGLVEPLERLTERIGWSWSAIEHLLSVKNSAELREAHKVVQPKVIEFFNHFSQSQPVYKAYKAIYGSSEWDNLDPAQKRIVEAAMRDAELSGVGLEGELKEKFNAIQMELAELSTNFSNHVLDATKAFSMTLTLPEEIEGLPPSLLGQAAQAARLDGDDKATPENGPWCITLDYPSYVPFMQHSCRRDLREKLYRAFVSRAASGEFDNSPLIARILELRKQKAELLGYPTYAELSLARKMAPNVEAVEKLLEELRQSSYTAAVAEYAELKEFAKTQGSSTLGDLKHWDTSYWAERQRETKFNFTVEELRPYFPLPQVLEGLFALVKRLFGVTVVAADGKAPIWHESVRFFEIQNEQNQAIAYFYLDPYSRPAEKRGGAWMNDCIARAKVIEDGQHITRLPVAYLICNQSPPVDGKPSLMTFGEVETLFHEFGHGLQHMLTKVD